jgi:hypothetical protein
MVLSRAKSNQILFFILLALTIALFFFDRLFVYTPTIFTLALAVLAIKQGLETYRRRTVLRDNEIEHRTAFGRRKIARYSEVSVLEQKEKAIVIVGKNLEIILRDRDGDLNAISEILRKKVPNYLRIT